MGGTLICIEGGRLGLAPPRNFRGRGLGLGEPPKRLRRRERDGKGLDQTRGLSRSLAPLPPPPPTVIVTLIWTVSDNCQPQYWASSLLGEV